MLRGLAGPAQCLSLPPCERTCGGAEANATHRYSSLLCKRHRRLPHEMCSHFCGAQNLSCRGRAPLRRLCAQALSQVIPVHVDTASMQLLCSRSDVAVVFALRGLNEGALPRIEGLACGSDVVTHGFKAEIGAKYFHVWFGRRCCIFNLRTVVM